MAEQERSRSRRQQVGVGVRVGGAVVVLTKASSVELAGVVVYHSLSRRDLGQKRMQDLIWSVSKS